MVSEPSLSRFLPAQKHVVGSPVTALRLETQVKLIIHWAKNFESKVVCVANVHMLVEAHWNSDFAQILKKADLVTPDGMPLVWMLKFLGIKQQDRVAGMDVFTSSCQLAAQKKIGIYLLGSQPMILSRMKQRLEQEFPTLEILGMESLPFRPITPEEDILITQKINKSGAGVVFVSLGCPKQEHWMACHKDKVNAVMVGVGGVFPVYAGIHSRAPRWMRDAGLEWAFRLIQEPRRLWSRYWKTNTKFIVLALKQILVEKLKLALLNVNKVDEKMLLESNYCRPLNKS